MNTLEKIQSCIKPELAALNERISTSLSSDNTLMDSIIKGYLKSKGKMIRPILVILSAKLFGEVNDDVISAAAAVEMLHNASLIHDDVVDETKLRRNCPTLNAIWDNHIAVLVGDFFVSTSLQQAIASGDIRIIDSLARLGRLLSLGEIDQISNARYHNLDEEAYYGVISRKTASLFVSCVEMGAYAVKAPEEALEAIREYAELLGRCFQIKDDIFDYYDNAVGKPTGNDLREGKITLPLLHVLNDDRLPCHVQMLELSERERLTPGEIDTLVAYARDNGGIDYAYDVMERLHARADEIITGAYPDNDASRALREIFAYVIARKY